MTLLELSQLITCPNCKVGHVKNWIQRKYRNSGNPDYPNIWYETGFICDICNAETIFTDEKLIEFVTYRITFEKIKN